MYLLMHKKLKFLNIAKLSHLKLLSFFIIIHSSPIIHFPNFLSYLNFYYNFIAVLVHFKWGSVLLAHPTALIKTALNLFYF